MRNRTNVERGSRAWILRLSYIRCYYNASTNTVHPWDNPLTLDQRMGSADS